MTKDRPLGRPDAADSGSHFRSPDIFPQAAADLLSGKGEGIVMKPADIPGMEVANE